MMERYFEVTDKSDLYDNYMDYLDYEKMMRNVVNEFMDAQGIDTDTYSYRGETFYILPTDNDIDKFNKSLCKPLSSGVRAFKVNSKIGKAWIKVLEEKSAEDRCKPYVGFYFKDCMGNNRSRVFAVGDKVYCSFESEHNFSDTPEGFIEMKASEFFKIVEDENERRQLARRQK